MMKSIYAKKRIIIAGLISSKINEQDFISQVENEIQQSGGIIVGEIIQRRGVSRSVKQGGAQKLDQPLSSATYISTGKAEELKALCSEMDCDAVVFVNQLTPKQSQTLALLTDCEIFSAEP